MPSTTPNMNLILPDIANPATTGPEWAAELNAALQRLDSHDHSSGQGLKITPAGLNISLDLPMNAKSLLNTNKVGLVNQTVVLSGVANANSISVVNGNLYITNSGGVPVQITNGTSVVNTTVIPASPLMPSGTVLDFAGSTIPAGFLPCDGSAVSRATYPDLFASLGTAWGVGDGTTTFNIPNFNGKVAVGSGTYIDSVAGSTTRSLAQSVGAANHILTTGQMPSHTHIQNAHSHAIPLFGTLPFQINNATGFTPVAGGPYSTDPTTATNQNTGGDLAHNNMQPSLVTNKMIKT